MCKCTPTIRTPFCGKKGCEWPDFKSIQVLSQEKDAARYRWLRDNVFEVNCEGRTADCSAKWMLPRLIAEDSTGRKFTFDEIVDIQMKRSGE